MAHPTVVNAVFQRLTDNWTQTPVAEMNKGFGTATALEFLAVQFPASSTRRWAVNRKYNREEGGIRFVLNVESNGGRQRAADLFNALYALFSDQTFGGVTTYAADTPFYDDSSDNGNYFTLAFVVPFSFNFVG